MNNLAAGYAPAMSTPSRIGRLEVHQWGEPGSGRTRFAYVLDELQACDEPAALVAVSPAPLSRRERVMRVLGRLIAGKRP